MKSDYDVLIVGGGPAGTAAALALGRMGRTVLVCDDNRPRNAKAAHMNNFPSHDGTPPAEWRTQTRRELGRYPSVEFQHASVDAVEREGAYFRAQLSIGNAPRFRRVLLAYGVVDRLPPAPGFQELWGRSVLHCPYCHGFEVRGERLGLVANGAAAEHLLPMVHSLSTDTTLFTNGVADLSGAFRALLAARQVPLVEATIRSLVHEDGCLRAIVLEDGQTHARDRLFVAPTLPVQSKSAIGVRLGCQTTEHGYYKVTPVAKTTVDGVFAAGDIVTGQHSVLAAAASGQLAAAGIVSEITKEDFAGYPGTSP